MTFLSGQDDFFETANQPISVRHLSQPYHKMTKKYYLCMQCLTDVANKVQIKEIKQSIKAY